MATLQMGSVEVEFGTVPESNLVILAQRSLNHIFHNERDAAVPADKFNGDAAKLATARADWENAKRELILTGQLGTRQGGPRLSELEKEIAQVTLKRVRKQVAAINKKYNLAVKIPAKMDEEFKIGNDTRTLRIMLEKQFAAHGDEIKAQAAKNLAEQTRAADRAVAASQGELPDLAAMGL